MAASDVFLVKAIVVGAGKLCVKTMAKEVAEDVGKNVISDIGKSWKFGTFKPLAKWGSQMAKRGWTPQQITEAIQSGEKFTAENLVNKGNTATRYVHPQTGRSVVIDNITKEIIHVGGNDFKY
jgi:hypothetical protein